MNQIKKREQEFGDDPLAIRETDHYQHEYVESFVEKWDDLIDWESRAESEGTVPASLPPATYEIDFESPHMASRANARSGPYPITPCRTAGQQSCGIRLKDKSAPDVQTMEAPTQRGNANKAFPLPQPRDGKIHKNNRYLTLVRAIRPRLSKSKKRPVRRCHGNCRSGTWNAPYPARACRNAARHVH